MEMDRQGFPQVGRAPQLSSLAADAVWALFCRRCRAYLDTRRSDRASNGRPGRLWLPLRDWNLGQSKCLISKSRS
jgi:hypothetical protein